MLSRLLLLCFGFLLSFSTFAQQPPNWTAEQLMSPAELAGRIQSQKNIPLILSVGPMALIPNSENIGPASDPESLDSLKARVKSLSKKTEIVIYCGCCPFDKCPNVRPAIAALRNLQFTNVRLLNLPISIKADWIDKDYPTVDP